MLLVNEKLKPFYEMLAAKHTRDNCTEAKCTSMGDVHWMCYFFISYIILLLMYFTVLKYNLCI